jgi:hypothetical protein
MVATLPLQSPSFQLIKREVSLPKPVEYQFTKGGKEPFPLRSDYRLNTADAFAMYL